jgi:hypothetical protein
VDPRLRTVLQREIFSSQARPHLQKELHQLRSIMTVENFDKLLRILKQRDDLPSTEGFDRSAMEEWLMDIIYQNDL